MRSAMYNLAVHEIFEFFHNSRLIRRIQQKEI